MMPLTTIVIINIVIVTAALYLAFIASCGHCYLCFTVVETKDLQGVFPR